jgi:hypothetical protein
MTRTGYKIIFTSLGFLAVILDNLPRDKQALRAATLAQLIESFCASSVPEAFDVPNIGGAEQRRRLPLSSSAPTFAALEVRK